MHVTSERFRLTGDIEAIDDALALEAPEGFICQTGPQSARLTTLLPVRDSERFQAVIRAFNKIQEKFGFVRPRSSKSITTFSSPTVS